MSLEGFWVSNVIFHMIDELVTSADMNSAAYDTFKEWNPDKEIYV